MVNQEILLQGNWQDIDALKDRVDRMRISVAMRRGAHWTNLAMGVMRLSPSFGPKCVD